VLLSRNTTDAVVTRNEFLLTGDSAIVVVGNTNGILGDSVGGRWWSPGHNCHTPHIHN
jgi:hypothetical protein